MTVFVDNERITWRGKLWCHLVADSLDELHAFAAVLGLKRGWFQEKASYPHYDVTTEVRDRARVLARCRVGRLRSLPAPACCAWNCARFSQLRPARHRQT